MTPDPKEPAAAPAPETPPATFQKGVRVRVRLANDDGTILGSAQGGDWLVKLDKGTRVAVNERDMSLLNPPKPAAPPAESAALPPKEGEKTTEEVHAETVAANAAKTNGGGKKPKKGKAEEPESPEEPAK